jgi:hypothetical protein
MNRVKLTICFIGAVITLLAIQCVLKNTDEIDRFRLYDDSVTACRPPGDEGEKLVATLYKSADGGPLMLHCTYHSTIEVVK